MLLVYVYSHILNCISNWVRRPVSQGGDPYQECWQVDGKVTLSPKKISYITLRLLWQIVMVSIGRHPNNYTVIGNSSHSITTCAHNSNHRSLCRTNYFKYWWFQIRVSWNALLRGFTSLHYEHVTEGLLFLPTIQHCFPTLLLYYSTLYFFFILMEALSSCVCNNINNTQLWAIHWKKNQPVFCFLHSIGPMLNMR